MPKAHPLTVICRQCGGKNVMRDAWASWDNRKQDWVLSAVFDAGFCDDCGGEATLEEVGLAELE